MAETHIPLVFWERKIYLWGLGSGWLRPGDGIISLRTFL